MNEMTPTPKDLQPKGSEKMTIEIDIDFLPTGEVTNIGLQGRRAPAKVTVGTLEDYATPPSEQVFDRVRRAVFDEFKSSPAKTVRQRVEELNKHFINHDAYIDLVAGHHIILDGSFSREDIKAILHIM